MDEKAKCECKAPECCPVCGVLKVFQDTREMLAAFKHLDERVARLEGHAEPAFAFTMEADRGIYEP